MTQQSGFDDAALKAELDAAAAALQAFARGPAQRAADDVGASFENAGERIAQALGRAAAGGEDAFRRLVKTALEEMAKLALDRIFTSGAANAPAPGASVPPANPISIHFHLGAGADAAGVARHQGQIAAALARAVAYGRRNL